MKEAVSSIYASQGVKGFYRGLWIKTPGPTIQHAAALGIMIWNKKRAAQNNERSEDKQTSSPLLTPTQSRNKL